MTGGTLIGYSSQIFGRRFSIIVISIVGGALLYPYCFTPNKKVIAAAFFEQFCVQGAWGVIPIHLMELSPGAFRTFVVGTSYQLGNLVSSASSTIESTIGERFPLPPKETTHGPVKRYEYGKVMAIFMGCVYAYVIIITRKHPNISDVASWLTFDALVIGPEYLGRAFDVANDDDTREAVGDAAFADHRAGATARSSDSDHGEKHAGSDDRKESI